MSAWLADGMLILIAIGLLLLGRAGLIASLWSSAGPQADGWAVIVTLIRGFPFDGRTATVACLPLLVLSLSALRFPWTQARQRIRAWYLSCFASIALLATVGDHFYYREYNDQFNHFLFGTIYDDQIAILQTVWKQYPVVQIALVEGAVIWASAWVFLRLFRWQPLAKPIARLEIPALIMTTILMLAVIVCAARGSISRLPAQSKNVAVTADAFLNRMVLNPFAALDQAIGSWKETRSEASEKTWIPDGDVSAAAQRWFATGTRPADLDAACERTALGTSQAPEHVVLVLMESCSGWTFLPRWQALGLADGLSQLAHRGIAVERFVSAGPGTIYSVGPLLTGLADTGLMQSYIASCSQTFPTSTAAIFRRLGYRTRFFYSGYLSWQRLGELVQSQGFDEVHGGGEISNWLEGQEWGVDDGHLYDWVAPHIRPGERTFDVILTTSNHPPYNVDVAAAGFPLTAWPPGLDHDGVDDLRVLGHHWYASQAASHFVAQVELAAPNTLFAITGDHFGRRFPNRHPNAFERSAVPCILVGAGLAGLRLAPDTAGSHLDLIPTLVERCAPAGFRYHAFGSDLLGPTPPTVGVGSVGALTTTGEAAWNDLGDARSASAAELEQWHRRAADLAGLAWWRLMRGPMLAVTKASTSPPASTSMSGH